MQETQFQSLDQEDPLEMLDITKYNEVQLFKVYDLIIFNTCILLLNHHHYQDNRHIHHPQMVLCIQSLPCP